MSDLPEPVRAFLDQGGEQVVLVSPGVRVVGPVGARDVAGVDLPARELSGRYARVLVAVMDRVDLRAAVLPHAVRAPVVAVWVAWLPSSPGLVPRPEWPPMKAFRTQPVGDGYLVVARFEQPVRAANVVRELGRQSVWQAPPPAGGLVVDDGSGPVTGLEERDVPPDVVLEPTARVVEHVVTGRVPVVEREIDGLPLFSLDERVLNPIGFVADVDGPVVTLESLTSGSLEEQVPTEALVRSLRDARGVRGDRIDVLQAGILVAGLSMAGVPVSVSSVEGAVAAVLGPTMVDALTAPVDLDDVLAREEHSVVLRRAALRTFSTGTRRRMAADRIGVRVAPEPSVSVVLATKRPDMLAFALRQVRKQRGVDLQLVLAAHGFTPDADVLRELGPERLVVRPQDEATLFGDVLADAVTAADGDLVLKMDDDDWYGPDFVTDLLLARAYSGAELVGTPSEMHYLVPEDVTVRRGHQAELYAHFVAGGTMLVDRGLLRSVGSFRSVRKYVDAQLLHAVGEAGAAIYRTQGLGYLLRRNASGHTWQVDMDYLLDPVRVAEIRPGFAPSRLLEYDQSERPSPG
jgi:hypothetical protein